MVQKSRPHESPTRLLGLVRGIRCCTHNLIDLLADTFMSKTARLYRDTRTASAASGSGLDKLNDDLQDVTRIMTKNMEELLWRGDSLDRRCSVVLSKTFNNPLACRNVAFVNIFTLRVREVS